MIVGKLLWSRVGTDVVVARPNSFDRSSGRGTELIGARMQAEERKIVDEMLIGRNDLMIDRYLKLLEEEFHSE